MSETAKRRLISYTIAFVLGGLIAWFVASNYGFSEAESNMIRYRILCDAFSIPGVVLICCGVLSWIADQGTFDSLAYAGKNLLRFFQKGVAHQRYYDFVEERREKRAQKEKGHFLFLIVTGAVFLLAAGVFMFLFYRLYNA